MNFPKLYECDPQKNTECNKRNCGNPCKYTTRKEFSREPSEKMTPELAFMVLDATRRERCEDTPRTRAACNVAQGALYLQMKASPYPDGDENILEHFNLKVPQGTNVAIVGETGAGKSTLVNLVCRFYEPTEGQVLIDGRDARERSQLWLHSNIGYVLQTPHLFSGTVLENLRYGRENATMGEIEAAVRAVSAEGIIERLPDGYRSDVGEGGNSLSTGEKQLLSFARALLADPRIFVLDEATSSVDTVTERLIQDAIEKVMDGRTSFVIAHRLSTIRRADVILVVNAGRIVERGSHAELMAKKGVYYGLYTRQYREEQIQASMENE